MSDLKRTLHSIDGIIDTYTGGKHSAEDIITMRRELSGHLYYLSSYVKATYSDSVVSYARRKRTMARETLAALQKDAKTRMNKAEVEAEMTDAVMEAHKEQARAEGEREELKARMYAINEVLQSMSHEIAYLRREKENTYHQSTH